eukprot:bmy_09432T0
MAESEKWVEGEGWDCGRRERRVSGTFQGARASGARLRGRSKEVEISLQPRSVGAGVPGPLRGSLELGSAQPCPTSWQRLDAPRTWRRCPGGGGRVVKNGPAPRPFLASRVRPVAKVLGHGQRPPEGQRREAADPWWWQQAAGACVGGSEEGRREEAGFLKPSQPSKTDQQTDRQLARGAGGHSCFSKYLRGAGRSPAGQGCANLGRQGTASRRGMSRRVPRATVPGWGVGADPLMSPRGGQGPEGRGEADEALLLREPLCPLGARPARPLRAR